MLLIKNDEFSRGIDKEVLILRNFIKVLIFVSVDVVAKWPHHRW